MDNPTDPTVPPSVIPSQPGALAVDFASDLDFGTHAMDGKTTEFTGKVKTGSTGDKGTPLLAWHDLRGANSTAYRIQAALTTPFNMTNTSLSFAAGTPLNTSTKGATDVSAIKTKAVTLNNDGTAAEIATGTGAVSGYYANSFGASGVKLTVPVSSQSAGAYTATVTWTLTLAQ